MYRFGPTTAHVTSVQYRHTSFLRGLELLDCEDQKVSDRTLAAKPRSLLSAPTLPQAAGAFSPSPPIALSHQPQLTPDDGETSTPTTTASTTPMAAASILDDGVSSIRDSGSKCGKNETQQPAERNDTLRSSAWAEEESRKASAVALNGEGSGDEEGSAAKRNEDQDEENSRHIMYEQDEGGTSSGLANVPQDVKPNRRSEGDRLPGIAHLDRNMPTPWSSSGGDGSVRQYRRATEHDDRSVASRWTAPFSSLRRGDALAGSEHHASPHRYFDHGHHAHGQSHGGPASSSRLPSIAPSHTPYKRPGSPLQAAAHRDREENEGDFHRRRYTYAQTQQPVSPSSRQRLSHDQGDTTAEPQHMRTSEFHPSWQDAPRHHAALPPRGSYPPFSGPHDDRPTLPLLPVRGGSVGGVSRNSPPPPMHHHPARRAHGDSTSSSGSSGEHPSSHTHYHQRAVVGMPRASVSGLRSLSMSYPYEVSSVPGAPAHEHAYADAMYYDDRAPPPRHYGDQHHAASTHSSPRSHPYGLHSVGGVGGSSSVDVDGSPPSMPRRRGKLPKPVTDLLKTWLLDHAAHPYPTEDEKRRLCAATNLSISQVSNWFINARRRILIPQGSGQFGVGPGASGATGAVHAAGGGNGGSAISTPHQSPGPVMHGNHRQSHVYQPHDDLPRRHSHQPYHHAAAAAADEAEAAAVRRAQYGVPALPTPAPRNHASAYGHAPPPHYGAGNGVHPQQHDYPLQHSSGGRAPPPMHYRTHDYNYQRSTEHSPRNSLAQETP